MTLELRFGATMPLGGRETVWQARWLEGLGFDYLAVGEHFIRGNPPSPSYAALPLLGVAAGATERIRLLSSVLLAPFYHPTVLAKLATTLDVASDGRLTLGVGIGGEFPVEFKAAGLNVKHRGRQTDECLEVLRKLWTEECVTHKGRHFQLDNVTLSPRSVQDPHPPVWVAGRRDAAMVRAARFGDGWLPYFYSPERYQESLEKITAIASQDGRDMSRFPMGILSVHIDLSFGCRSCGHRRRHTGKPIPVRRRFSQGRATLLPAWSSRAVPRQDDGVLQGRGPPVRLFCRLSTGRHDPAY